MSSLQKLPEAALNFLNSTASRIGEAQYIAGFRVGGTRELAIEKNRAQIYVYTERCSGQAPSEFGAPHRSYAAGKSRNSNLNSKNAPALVVGKPIEYWKFDNLGDFTRFLKWYASI